MEANVDTHGDKPVSVQTKPMVETIAGTLARSRPSHFARK